MISRESSRQGCVSKISLEVGSKSVKNILGSDEVGPRTRDGAALNKQEGYGGQVNRPDVETARKEDFQQADGEKPAPQNEVADIKNDDDSVQIQNVAEDDMEANEQNPLNQFYEMYGTNLGLEQTPGSRDSQNLADQANQANGQNQQKQFEYVQQRSTDF